MSVPVYSQISYIDGGVTAFIATVDDLLMCFSMLCKVRTCEEPFPTYHSIYVVIAHMTRISAVFKAVIC